MRGIPKWLKGWGGPAILTACAVVVVAGIVLERNLPNGFVRPGSGRHQWDGVIPDVYGTGGPPMAVAIGLGVIVLGGGLWFLRVHTPREERPDVRPVQYNLATWVLLLDQGAHYDRVISAIARSDMSRLSGRRLAAARLGNAIRPEDIRAGFGMIPEKSPFHNRLARAAKRLIGDQAAQVALEGGSEGEACLLLFTCTDLAVEQVPADATPERIIHALRISVAGHPGEHSVMYVRHRLIDEAIGRRAVETLRANVLARTRTV